MNDISQSNAGNEMTNATRQGAPRHGDQLQIDTGTYEILRDDVVIGQLYVQEDPEYPGNSRQRIEHWGLYPSFTSPSSSQRDVSLRFKYVEGGYGNASDFRTALRTITGVRYIKAQCVEQAP